MKRFSKAFASGVSVVKSAVGKDIWRSRGCSLAGPDVEDLVRGCNEEFGECTVVRSQFSFGVCRVEETGN